MKEKYFFLQRFLKGERSRKKKLFKNPRERERWG